MAGQEERSQAAIANDLRAARLLYDLATTNTVTTDVGAPSHAERKDLFHKVYELLRRHGYIKRIPPQACPSGGARKRGGL